MAADENNNIYVFGGKDESNRLNDIWCFGLSDCKFQRLKDDGEIPVVRNGHTLDYYQGKLYVFGGIHDITWELDDLHIYEIKVKYTLFSETNGPLSNKTLPAKSKRNNSNTKKV